MLKFFLNKHGPIFSVFQQVGTSPNHLTWPIHKILIGFSRLEPIYLLLGASLLRTIEWGVLTQDYSSKQSHFGRRFPCEKVPKVKQTKQKRGLLEKLKHWSITVRPICMLSLYWNIY